MTMRRVVLMVAATCAALLTPTASVFAQTGSPCANGKVALVNANRIMASIPAYVQAEALLAKEADGYRAELAKQKAALDSAGAAYSDRATLLTASQKTAEMKKLQEQNDALQKHIADLTAKADQRQAELLQPISVRVQEMLDGMRAELNCAIIFDVSAAGGIASADKSLDLTDRMIDRLKAPDPATKPVVNPPVKPPTGGGIKPPGGGGGGGGTEPLAAPTPTKP
jgi:outer membrane protein